MFFICTFNENYAAFDNLHCCFENLLLVLFKPTSPTSFCSIFLQFQFHTVIGGPCIQLQVDRF